MNGPNSKDFFSSFLETAEGAPDKGAEAAPGAEAAIEKTILGFLTSREGPVSVKEMLAQLSVPPSLAIEALQRLSSAGLIDYKRVESDDWVSLSDLGRRVSV
jgi:predicted transcriptional regulator